MIGPGNGDPLTGHGGIRRVADGAVIFDLQQIVDHLAAGYGGAGKQQSDRWDGPLRQDGILRDERALRRRGDGAPKEHRHRIAAAHRPKRQAGGQGHRGIQQLLFRFHRLDGVPGAAAAIDEPSHFQGDALVTGGVGVQAVGAVDTAGAVVVPQHPGQPVKQPIRQRAEGDAVGGADLSHGMGVVLQLQALPVVALGVGLPLRAGNVVCRAADVVVLGAGENVDRFHRIPLDQSGAQGLHGPVEGGGVRVLHGAQRPACHPVVDTAEDDDRVGVAHGCVAFVEGLDALLPGGHLVHFGGNAAAAEAVGVDGGKAAQLPQPFVEDLVGAGAVGHAVAQHVDGLAEIPAGVGHGHPVHRQLVRLHRQIRETGGVPHGPKAHEPVLAGGGKGLVHRVVVQPLAGHEVGDVVAGVGHVVLFLAAEDVGPVAEGQGLGAGVDGHAPQRQDPAHAAAFSLSPYVGGSEGDIGAEGLAVDGPAPRHQRALTSGNGVVLADDDVLHGRGVVQ